MIESLAEQMATTPWGLLVTVWVSVLIAVTIVGIRSTRQERRRMTAEQLRKAEALMGLSTEQLLLRARWYPGRRVGVSSYGRHLREEGIEIAPEALQFLCEFAGLQVEHLDHRRRWDFFRIDLQPGRVYRSGAFLDQNEDLFAIGEAHVGFVTLLMGPTGRVYGGVEGALVRLGLDGRQALETLCQGRTNWGSLMHKNRRAD